MIYDIIIIGGGCSGLAAGMYAGRFKMKTIVLAETLGGTIINTDHVENYPGFKTISGMDLAKRIEDHAREYKIDIITKKVSKVEKSKSGFTVTADKKYEGKTILFANGTKVRRLGIPGENEFDKKGVHYCALCDGPVYQNKVIGVVGGSDSASIESLILSEFAKKVYIIYRKEKIRAEPINYERVMQNKKIEIINNTNVLEVKGDKFVNGAVLDKPYKGKKLLPMDALFVEIGRIPLSDLAKSLGVKINQKGEIIINKASETNIPGAYAAGDVTDAIFKQVALGTAEAIAGVYSAYNYIRVLELKKK
jgi:thioredoxin reductase (NADPH)